jgi:hypothetical protein
MNIKTLLLISILLLNAIVGRSQEPRVLLFEVFSSATCYPCRYANEDLKTLLDTKASNEYVLVKFQQNFPGTGDPYCNQHCIDRHRGLYNFGTSNLAIPELHIDRKMPATLFSKLRDSLYNAYKSVPATYKLSGTYSVSGQTVSAKIKYTPLEISYPNTKLFLAVVETETVNNAKRNGETKFYNIMKQMLSTEGHGSTDISSTALGVQDSITFTYTFKGHYSLPVNGQKENWINDSIAHSVENFDNLKVVVWVQGFVDGDYPVYQAANLVKEMPTSVNNITGTLKDIMLYPNPSSQTLTISLHAIEDNLITVSIYSILGIKVDTFTFKASSQNENTMTLNVGHLPSGKYTVFISDTKHNTYSEQITVVR